MNRIQFWILTGLSGLVVVLMVAQIVLVRLAAQDQNRNAAAQQYLSLGQTSQGMVKQLAVRIFQDSQKTADPTLKQVLDRQQITYNPNPSADSNSTDNPAAPAPAPAPAPTH